jgi:hypothetical protein
MEANVKENERCIKVTEKPQTRPRITFNQAKGTKKWMIGLNHILLDFMRHFSECHRNFVFAPGYNSEELMEQVNQRLRFFKTGEILKEAAYDGNSWDARIDYIFKRINAVVVREL